MSSIIPRVVCPIWGETKTVHYASMKKCEWILEEDTADELHEYKNLGVLKNCIGSSNKAGMIFSSHLDCQKVNLHINIYIYIYTSNVGGRHVYRLCYLVLSFLLQAYY